MFDDRPQLFDARSQCSTSLFGGCNQNSVIKNHTFHAKSQFWKYEIKKFTLIVKYFNECIKIRQPNSNFAYIDASHQYHKRLAHLEQLAVTDVSIIIHVIYSESKTKRS